MVPYTETETYKYWLMRAEADLRQLSERRAIAEKISKRLRTPDQQDDFVKIPSKLKKLSERINDLKDLTISPAERCYVLSEVDGTKWTTEELRLNAEPLANNEGFGEKSLKKKYDLPTDCSSETCDLIKHVDGVRVLYEEVKCIEGKNGVLQHIQTGTHGRAAWGAWLLKFVKSETYKKINDEHLLKMLTGEHLQEVFNSDASPLPVDVRGDLFGSLSPSKILGDYDAVHATHSKGHIRVPREDCEKAWELDGVTKAGPAYRLKLSYVDARLRASLPATNDMIDVAAKQ